MAQTKNVFAAALPEEELTDDVSAAALPEDEYLACMGVALQEGLEEYFSQVPTLPEDALQHGGLSFEGGYSTEYQCKGMGPVLRDQAIALMAQRIMSIKSAEDFSTFCRYVQFTLEAGDLDISETQSLEVKKLCLVEKYVTFMIGAKGQNIYASSWEGAVLAEYFGMTFFINDQKLPDVPSFMTDPATNFPFEIKLTHAKKHYAVFGHTSSNGDCLFNAIGQTIADIWVREKKGGVATGRATQQERYRQSMSVPAIEDTSEVHGNEVACEAASQPIESPRKVPTAEVPLPAVQDLKKASIASPLISSQKSEATVQPQLQAPVKKSRASHPSGLLNSRLSSKDKTSPLESIRAELDYPFTKNEVMAFVALTLFVNLVFKWIRARGMVENLEGATERQVATVA